MQSPLALNKINIRFSQDNEFVALTKPNTAPVANKKGRLVELPVVIPMGFTLGWASPTDLNSALPDEWSGVAAAPF